METELKDFDLYIQKKLNTIDNRYRLAIHIILLECFKNVGTNKNDMIESVKKYVIDDELNKICNASFMNKTYLKPFIQLNYENRMKLLNEVIHILEDAEDNNGFLVIQKDVVQKLTKDNNHSNKDNSFLERLALMNESSIKKRIIKVNNENIGQVCIDPVLKKITGEKLETIRSGRYKYINYETKVKWECDDKFDENELEEACVKDLELIIHNFDEIERKCLDRILKCYDFANEKNINLINIDISFFVANKRKKSINAYMVFECDIGWPCGSMDIYIEKDTKQIKILNFNLD